MNFASLRQAASLFCSLLLFSSQALAQEPGTPSQTPLLKQSQIQAMLHPDPKRAQKAAERGDKAVAQGRVEEALADYDEAARYAPQDAAIVGRAAALRSKLVREHVDTAERQALAGDLRHAREEMRAALSVDPDNTIVTERLAQMQAMEEDEPRSKSETQFAGVPRIQPKGGKQSFTLHGDTRAVYEQVALAFGLKVAFDPDLVARPVELRVDDVDFFTALSLLGTETGTFWRPVNPALFFVASDTQEKRRAYGLQAEQTFALPASVGPEEMTELLRVLREITGATHIELDSHSRTITMRDSPATLALAGGVIQQVEQARGEVMLEIELLEVDTNTARNLGITPPTTSRLIPIDPNLLNQVRQAKDLAALTTLIAGLFGTSGGAAGLTSLVPPLVVVGGGKTTFLLTLPGATADFSDALSLVRSGRQVLLRAQNGKPATFFVGDRFPVTLSLLSGSLGNSTFTPNPGGTSITLPIQQFNVGKDPAALVNADFRNNGLQDLAVVNQIDNSLTILLNQGIRASPQFAPTSASPIALGTARITAPPVPVALASANLNPGTGTGQDSFPDLLVTDPVGNTVTIFLANPAGDGTFTQKGAPIAVGNNPSSIAVADFNGDGKQDFAVANEDDDSISIFLGDGTGKFTAAPDSPFSLSRQLAISTTSLPDGVLNTAYSAALHSTGGTGAVTWSIAGGSLPSGLTLNSSTGAITGTPTVAAGFFGLILKVADSATPPVSVTISLGISISAVAPALAISSASLPNGSIGTPYDQILTVTGGTPPFTWSILARSLPVGLNLNTTTGEISGIPTSTTTPAPTSTFVIEVKDSSGAPLTAQKQFSLTPSTAPERGPVAIAVNDFNRDGRQDLAVVNQTTNNISILLGNGDGTFTEASGSPISVGKLPVAIASGTLSGSIGPALAVVNQADNTLSVLLGKGDGTFAAALQSPFNTGLTPSGVAIADFLGQGNGGIAVTNTGANTVSVFVDLGSGIITRELEPGAGTSPGAIVAAPFTNSSLPDVVVTNNISGAAGQVTLIPSPSSLFSNSSIGQQPYPASEFIDLGVKIKATPTLHDNNEVTLQLEFEIRALAGSSVNGIPVISNRTLSQTVRVKEDEPTLISGLLDVEQTRTITGLPGFAEIPGAAGYAFSRHNNTLQDTELLILVTPRKLRLPPRSSRTIFAGRGDIGGRGSVGANAPLAPPPQPQPQPQP